MSELANITSPAVSPMLRFVSEFRHLLYCVDAVEGKENKMKISLKIFQKINRDLPEVLAVQSINSSWIDFVCCVFNKINQLDDRYRAGEWNEINQELLDKFIEELVKAKDLTSDIIINYKGPYTTDIMIEAKDELIRLGKMRVIDPGCNALYWCGWWWR